MNTVNSKRTESSSGSSTLCVETGGISQVDELKKTLRHNILLHEHLIELLRDESASIENLSPEKLREANMRKKVIELEIDRTNRIISKLYIDCSRDPARFDAASRHEVGELMERLRGSIREALGAIGDTIASVRNARRGVVAGMQDLTRRRAAVTSYAKAQFS